MNEPIQKIGVQEIIVTHRPEKESSGRWDSIEQTAKILSYVAVPIVIAIFGWQVQGSLSKRNVSKEYVALAVSILNQTEKDVDPSLRSWAVDLLNANSPTKFSKEVTARLKAGEIRLPISEALHKAMSEADFETIVHEIVDATGLVPNFIVEEGSVPSAIALVKDGKRVLVYNPAFIHSLNKSAGTNWAAVAVLAHEIGHHLLGHTIGSDQGKPRNVQELEADYFAGFMLNKLGASIEEALAVYNSFPKGFSPTHGSHSQRLNSVKLGWEKAQSGEPVGP